MHGCEDKDELWTYFWLQWFQIIDSMESIPVISHIPLGSWEHCVYLFGLGTFQCTIKHSPISVLLHTVSAIVKNLEYLLAKSRGCDSWNSEKCMRVGSVAWMIDRISSRWRCAILKCMRVTYICWEMWFADVFTDLGNLCEITKPFRQSICICTLLTLTFFVFFSLC